MKKSEWVLLASELWKQTEDPIIGSLIEELIQKVNKNLGVILNDNFCKIDGSDGGQNPNSTRLPSSHRNRTF